MLARQIADDVRIWAEFPGGIVMVELARPRTQTRYTASSRTNWGGVAGISRT